MAAPQGQTDTMTRPFELKPISGIQFPRHVTLEEVAELIVEGKGRGWELLSRVGDLPQHLPLNQVVAVLQKVTKLQWKTENGDLAGTPTEKVTAALHEWTQDSMSFIAVIERKERGR